MAGRVGFSGLSAAGVKSRPWLLVGGQAVECSLSSSQRRAGWLACQPIKRQQDEDARRRGKRRARGVFAECDTLLVQCRLGRGGGGVRQGQIRVGPGRAGQGRARALGPGYSAAAVSLAVVRPSRVRGRTGLSLIKARHAQTGARRQNSTKQAKIPDDGGRRGRAMVLPMG